MAYTINATTDFVGNQIQNFLVHNTTPSAVAAAKGRLLYDTTNNWLVFGTSTEAWAKVLDSVNFVTQLLGTDTNTGLLKRTYNNGTTTWSVDANTYLTSNEAALNYMSLANWAGIKATYDNAIDKLSEKQDDIDGRVETLEEALALGEEADSTINTWNEVKEFLASVDASEDLAAILSGLQSQINNRASKQVEHIVVMSGASTPLSFEIELLQANVDATVQVFKVLTTNVATGNTFVTSCEQVLVDVQIGTKRPVANGTLKYYAIINFGQRVPGTYKVVITQ